MSDMFWIALELDFSKTGLNIMLSLMVKKLDAFKFDGVTESGNTANKSPSPWEAVINFLYVVRCTRIESTISGRFTWMSCGKLPEHKHRNSLESGQKFSDDNSAVSLK